MTRYRTQHCSAADERPGRRTVPRQADRTGRVRQFQYDNLARNTSEIWYNTASDANADQNRQRTLTFSYDAAGQMLSASDPAASYAYAYDALGRATSITQTIAGLTPQVVLSQQFDAAGQRTRLASTIGTVQDFVNDYVFDALGRNTRLDQHGVPGGKALATKRLDFSYDAASQPTNLKRYANLSGTQLVAETDYVHDQAGRLTGMTHFKGASIFADYDWAFDAANRMTRFESLTDGAVDYANDATGQLTGADYDYQTDEAYAYDENGNRVNNGYTVGPNNQMLSDGTFRYAYDVEGNRTHKYRDTSGNGQLGTGDTDITEYSWDHRNRLTKVTHRATYGGAADKIVEYAYDFGNRWVRKTLDTNADGAKDYSQVFVYDNNQIVLDFHRNGSQDLLVGHLRDRYLWGTAVDHILAEETVDGGAPELVRWPLTDHLNTVHDLAAYDSATDTTTVANHLTYAAFGALTAQTDPTVESLFRFTARPYDADSDLQYNLHRWYDLATGRWASEDPIGFFAGDVNLTRYVQDRPALFVDPSGLKKHATSGWAVTGLFEPAAGSEGAWRPFTFEGAKGLLTKLSGLYQASNKDASFLQSLIPSVDATFNKLYSTVSELKDLLSPVKADLRVQGVYRKGCVEGRRFSGWYDDQSHSSNVTLDQDSASLAAYEFKIQEARLAYASYQSFGITVGPIPLILRLRLSAEVEDFSASGIYIPAATPKFSGLTVSGKGKLTATAALGNEANAGSVFKVAAWAYSQYSAGFSIASETPFPHLTDFLTLKFSDSLLAFGFHAEAKVLKWEKAIDRALIKPLANGNFRVPLEISLPLT